MASLRRAHHSSALGDGLRDPVSALQEKVLASSGDLPAAAPVPHRPGERYVPRSVVLSGLPPAHRPRARDLPVAHASGSRREHSGEEVYTLAIILAEEGLLDRTLIYATDINPEAIAKARSGVYALDRVAPFAANHQESGGKVPFDEYYTAAYGHAAFDRRLRERVVFSDHQPRDRRVFAEVQVVSCRNVLIYFDRPLQDRAVALFRDALSRRGFLELGAMESRTALEPRRRLRTLRPGAEMVSAHT